MRLVWAWLALYHELLFADARGLHVGYGGQQVFAEADTGGKLSVFFKPERSFAEMAMPEMDFSIEGLPQQAVLGINSCFPSLPIALLELRSGKDDGNRDVISLFANLLADVSNSVLNSLGLDSGAKRIQQFKALTDPSENWVGVLGHAVALAGYYLTVADASRAVHEQQVLPVPMIGTFSLHGDDVTFVASRELLDLIDANPLSHAIGH